MKELEGLVKEFGNKVVEHHIIELNDEVSEPSRTLTVASDPTPTPTPTPTSLVP